MNFLSQIDLGSSILFIAVIAGLIGTAFVILRFAIIAINFLLFKFSGNSKKNK